MTRAQIDMTTYCPAELGAPKQLIYLALGFALFIQYSYNTVLISSPSQLSTNLADTLASELGILSRSHPIYILTLSSVPPGTNGAVSVLGVGMSALGGGLVGSIMILDLLLESSGCRVYGHWGWAAEMIVFSILSGLAGSLVCPFFFHFHTSQAETDSWIHS
jgi:uncharacterized membrane protein